MPAHTASTIVAQVVSGSHVLTVRGYSHTVGHGAGVSIRSDGFNVGGHTWHMSYYPDGFDSYLPPGRHWISVGLHLRQTDAMNFKVRFNFSLLDQLGKQVPKYTSRYYTVARIAQGNERVSARFIERNELEKSAYLKDDCFSFKCEVIVTNIRTEDVMAADSDSGVHGQLGRILETGEAADMTFKVGGETFAAHWCVLAARSSVFMARFLSNAATSIVPINGMEPRVLKAMLHFIYTDSLPKIDDDDDETIRKLFAAADTYNLEKLKMICENRLCNRIDTSTVITALEFAEQHGCIELKKACFQFLASCHNLMAIVGSDAFENLTTTQPNILEELVANVDTPPLDMLSSTPAHTSSTIVAQVASGSHVLTVQGYSDTVGHGVCRGIPSGIFSVGGHAWKIMYYPDGSDSSFADWISVFLLLHDNTDAKDVKVRCSFSLLDQMGEPVPEYTTTDQGHITKFQKFIRREELENSAYLKDDRFSIRCNVTIDKGIRMQPTAQLVTVPPPPDMLHQFGHILETGVGADMAFEVGGEAFAAHRRLLAARSSVFMAQLFGPVKENDATCIQINDMEAKVFKMMLCFIYTDALPSIDECEITEMAQHLFVAADRYDLQRLKLICTNMLCNRIDTITVAPMLAFAEQHGCDGLKKACFKFLASSQTLETDAPSDDFAAQPNIVEELVAQD